MSNIFKHADIHTDDEVKVAMPDSVPRRPNKLNTQGREISVKLNTFPVTQMPTSNIYQYDVSTSFPPYFHSCLNSC